MVISRLFFSSKSVGSRWSSLCACVATCTKYTCSNINRSAKQDKEQQNSVKRSVMGTDDVCTFVRNYFKIKWQSSSSSAYIYIASILKMATKRASSFWNSLRLATEMSFVNYWLKIIKFNKCLNTDYFPSSVFFLDRFTLFWRTVWTYEPWAFSLRKRL